MYDLLIFDLDGTLIDSVPDIAAALNWTLAQAGLPTHDEAAITRMVGDGVAELITRAVGPAELERVTELVEHFRRRYIASPAAATRLFAKVPETLARFDGRPLAVATNKPGALARLILDRLDLLHFFFRVVGEDDVARRKPDPEGTLLLCRTVGAAPSRTLLVGDSPIDAATAQAAGVDACLVSYGYGDPTALARAPTRFRIDRFDQLLALPGIIA